jgi:hypothetical protein
MQLQRARWLVGNKVPDTMLLLLIKVFGVAIHGMLSGLGFTMDMRLFGLVRKLIAIPNNEITVFTMEYSVQLGFPKNR